MTCPPQPGRLPDFLLVGAARAGTTTLARWLNAHPHCHISPEKEIFFFDSDELWAQGPGWYCSRFSQARRDQLVGEASTSYIFYEAVAERMASIVPEAKLIAIVRHPVDRAYSHYCFIRMLRDLYGPPEKRDFATAVREELDGCVERTREYVARGYYAEQLERLLSFYPTQQLKILLFDDLANAPRTVWHQLAEFLGLTPLPEPRHITRPVNATQAYKLQLFERLVRSARHKWDRPPSALSSRIDAWNQRRLPPMSPKLRELLIEHYRPHNIRLERMLSRNLPTWNA